MNVPQAIKVLLDVLNGPAHGSASGFGAFGGTAGNVSMLQAQLNAAITAWREQRQLAQLVAITNAMQAYGYLTDTHYQQIMKVLDGEQQHGAQHNQP